MGDELSLFAPVSRIWVRIFKNDIQGDPLR